jgi:hypothetical protein
MACEVALDAAAYFLVGLAILGNPGSAGGGYDVQDASGQAGDLRGLGKV